MGIFPKDRNLAVAPDRVEFDVRASDYQARAGEFHVRLDQFLQRKLSWRSRNSIQSLVHDGFVAVSAPGPERPDGRDEPTVERRPGRRLQHGHRVVVTIPEEHRLEVAADALEGLPVLHEDEHALVVDKPPGLAIHPGGKSLTDSVIQRVHAHLDEGVWPPKLCHRLDRETSGIVLLAKSRRALSFYMPAFERRQVRKEYLAVVRGVPAEDSGEIDLPIGPSLVSRIRLKMAVTSDGLPARTDWRVLERRGDRSLLACRIHTGRQHQIRVHLEALGHPVIGDKLYGVDEGVFLRHAAGDLTEADRVELGHPRHALHNHRLVFPAVDGGEDRDVRSPLPEDLVQLLDAGS